MQGFELATIFVAPADFQNFWETDSRKLVGLFLGPTRCFTIPPSHAVWAPRGPEASRDLIWDLSRPHLGISGGLFGDLFSLLSSLFSLLSALFSLLASLSSRLSSLFPLCSLPSSLFSRCSLPSSLAAAHFSDRTSHLSLRSLHQPIYVAPNCFDPLRLPPWPGGMREAIK